jgi:hypothetical protein
MAKITCVSVTIPNGDRPYVSFHRGEKITTLSIDITAKRAEHIVDLCRYNSDCIPMIHATNSFCPGFISLDFQFRERIL